jgi:hypothetical protein
VIVPRSLAFALPDAVAVPATVTGGQAPAHAPEHADVPPVSLTHRYTARPEPSVRNSPADEEAVLMTVEPDPLAPPLAALLGADAPAGELLAAAPVLLLLLPLAHAATRTATPTAPPTPAASRAGADIRCNTEFLIVFVSLSSAACPRQFPLPQMTVDVGTGRSANLDWIKRGKHNVIRTTNQR